MGLKNLACMLVQNDWNDKSFKMLPELNVPSGCMPMPLGFFSNDDPGLTLEHFYDRVIFVPDASVWVTASRALSALVFF